MALKLDDLLVKKKEPVPILDLSKSTANSKEELKKLLEKVPEYKIKMNKVRSEEIKIHDKKFLFKTTKKEEKEKSFPFANPVPSEMKSLRLDDLCSVNIQWKMLTSLRPKSKLDEEYFSKLIELGKLQLHAREKEKKKAISFYVRKSKNKAGILETKIISCKDCDEEFCQGETCRIFSYDSYERSTNLQTTNEESVSQEKNKKDKKKKSRKRKTSKKRKPQVNKNTEAKLKSIFTSKAPDTMRLNIKQKGSAVVQKQKQKPSLTVNKIKKTQTNKSKLQNKPKQINNLNKKALIKQIESIKRTEKSAKKQEKGKSKKKLNGVSKKN